MIYLGSLHRNLYETLIKCFSKFIPINIIQDIIIQKDLNLKIKEIVCDENIEKSETEIHSNESKEVLKYPQDYNSDIPIVIILDDLI